MHPRDPMEPERTGQLPGKGPAFVVYLSAGLVAGRLTASLPFLSENILLLFLAAILGSALVGGLHGGLAATLGSTLAGAWLLFEPTGTLAVAGSDRVRLLLLIGFGVLVSGLAHALVTSRLRLKLRERALAESNASYRALFDHTADAVYILDRTGRIIEANGAAVALFGRSRDALLGLGLDALRDPAHADDQAEADRLERAFDGEALRFEWNGLRSDGRSLPLEVALSRTSYFGRDALIAMARDLTERRTFEARLRQSQKLEAMGQLASGIAHDFNNLLTTIRGHAALLSSALAGDGELRSDVVEIERAAEIATHVTGQLLAFSRTHASSDREVVALNPAVSGLERMLRRVIGPRIQFVLDLDPEAGGVTMDPGQLEQVLINLVVNARDAMPEGGTITIATDRIADPRTGVACALLRVHDTGSGMTPDVIEQVFHPFFTTKPRGKGTGLGLSTVYGIVRQHEGQIDVDSVPGVGTTFDIVFPWAEAPGDGDDPDSDDRARLRDDPGARVLLVEDEAAVRSLMTRVLRDAGYEVQAVGSAEEGWERFEAGDPRPDVLVTDLSLPGEPGDHLARRILGQAPGLPILLASGSPDAELRFDGDADPATAVLEKPFTPAQLLRSLRQLLHRSDGIAA